MKKLLACCTIFALLGWVSYDGGKPQRRIPVKVILPIAKEAARKNDLPTGLVLSVIHAESACNANAVSCRGAKGLMQLMDATANELGVSDPFDPRQNVRGGTRYLRLLLNEFNGNVDHTLAAYNAGPLRVKKYGGVPPYAETREFVARVRRLYNQKYHKFDN